MGGKKKIHPCIDENTTLCSALKVGYSKNNFLTFYYYWNYSVEFYFDPVNMEGPDFYIILFSYIKNKKLPVLNIFTIAKSQENRIIFSKTPSYSLNKMNYREFDYWWSYRYWYDSSLLKPKEIYGIRIVFIKDFVDFFLKDNSITLEEFSLSYKPFYPWNDNLVEFFNYFIDPFNNDVFWSKEKIYYKPPIKKR